MTPDDTVLNEGGDMTRVVVTAVDSFGQVVPRNNCAVSITVDGAGDFLGESPITLEDGKTAFFVKTRAEQIGDITCSATGDKIEGARARIVVVRQ